jgi:hypothetical protein
MRRDNRHRTSKIEVPEKHSPYEVLRVFLKLGLISFGGPIARTWFVSAGSSGCRKIAARFSM